MTTLHLKKKGKYLKLPIQLFVHRLMLTRSALLNAHPDTVDTISKMSKLLLLTVLVFKKNQKSVTVECLPRSKWMTLNDKRIFSDPDILLMSWLQTSVLGLIGKEKVLKPFWNEQCREISQKLWLPTEIDFVGSLSNFWNGSSLQTESNSWFLIMTKINPQNQISPTTYFQSYMSTPVEQWIKEDIRTRKIRIYPNRNQKHQIKQWMGTRRFIYNQGLSKIKSGHKVDFYSLRNELVTSKNNPNIPEWQLDTPKDIRAGGLRDLVKNYKTAFSNLKIGNISKFKMGYCKKKDAPSIEIPKTAIKLKNGLTIYGRYIKESIKMSNRDKLTEIPEHDCRLQIRNGKWFLCVPIKVKADISNRGKRKRWCSMDPGVRVFQTIYSEDSVEQIKIRKELIRKLQITIDRFRSLRDRGIISKKRYTRRERRINYRMQSIIDDLHHKVADRLTNTYDNIILPSFESQEMTRKCKIKCANRNMLQLRHFVFKKRLKSKCALRGCTLDICTEEYTSQTCGVCGCLTKVEGLDVFTCTSCKVSIDRDVNGARNIAIKRLKEI